MDLQEEYFLRRKVPANMIKYVDKASLILRAKSGNVEHEWLHVSIECKNEPNHPAYYMVNVSANPVIYASADFTHFSYQNTRMLNEYRYEWDQYEGSVVEWAKSMSSKYNAVLSNEAVFVSWEMFVSNYDAWLSNFLPHRLIDVVADSVSDADMDFRLKCISSVEEWIADKYERVYICWRNMRQNLDQKNYADWLAKIMNHV